MRALFLDNTRSRRSGAANTVIGDVWPVYHQEGKLKKKGMHILPTYGGREDEWGCAARTIQSVCFMPVPAGPFNSGGFVLSAGKRMERSAVPSTAMAKRAVAWRQRDRHGAGDHGIWRMRKAGTGAVKYGGDAKPVASAAQTARQGGHRGTVKTPRAYRPACAASTCPLRACGASTRAG